MKNSLFNPAISRRKLNFNPEGFDLAKAIEARKTAVNIIPDQKTEVSEDHLNAFVDCQPIELVDYSSVAERELV